MFEEELHWSLDVMTGCKSEFGEADAWQVTGMGRIPEGPFGAGRHWSMAVILLVLLVTAASGSEDYYRVIGDMRESKPVGKGKAFLVTYQFLSCLL